MTAPAALNPLIASKNLSDLTDVAEAILALGLSGVDPLVVDTVVLTGSTTLVGGGFYACNSSGGAFTVTLPAAPADQTRVSIQIIDFGHNVEVLCGGSDHFFYAGALTTYQLSRLGHGIALQYSEAAASWVFLGISGDPGVTVEQFLAISTTVISAAGPTAIPPNTIVPVSTASNNVALNLPNAPADGTVCGAKMVTQGGTNTVTANCQGSDVINKVGGATSGTPLKLANQSVIYKYCAADAVWMVISEDLPLSDLDARYDVIGAAAAAAAASDPLGAAASAQATAETYAASAAATAQSNAETYAASVAATAQSDAEAASLPLTGGTMSGAIAMGAHKVTGLANGSAASDAAAFGQIPVGDTGWTALTPTSTPALVNSWTNYNAGTESSGYEYSGFRKTLDGMVVLNLYLKSGTATAVFTLPAGYRPLGTVDLAIIIVAGGVAALGSCSITPAGVVSVGTVAGATPTDILGTVMFFAEQ